MRYSIKVNEARNGSESIKGFASVTLGDSFKLNNIVIREDPREADKLFVAMPSYKDGQGEYKNIFNPTTKAFRDELYDNILKAFHELTNEQAKSSFTVEYDKKDTKMPEFTVRVTPYEREGSTIRGMASINFNGIAVNNVTVHQVDDKLFVSMPSYKTSQNDEHGKPIYKDVCHPITAKFHDKLYGAILQEYENAKEQAATKDSVVSKLNENKEATGKRDMDQKKAVQEKNQDQPKRDEVQR